VNQHSFVCMHIDDRFKLDKHMPFVRFFVALPVMRVKDYRA